VCCLAQQQQQYQSVALKQVSPELQVHCPLLLHQGALMHCDA
jgi:hypothetical protein